MDESILELPTTTFQNSIDSVMLEFYQDVISENEHPYNQQRLVSMSSSSSAAVPEAVEEAITTCSMTQSMIDIAAKQLYGLRLLCRTSEELIQNEICESESKLIRLFSKILIVKDRLKVDPMPAKLQEYPRTDQWLHIVGISDIVSKRLCEMLTVQNMLDMPNSELVSCMHMCHAKAEDIDRLTKALQKLKQWRDHQLYGVKTVDAELHWSAYKSASNSPFGGSSPKFGHHQRPSTSSLPGDTCLNVHSPHSPPSPPYPTESTPASPFTYMSPVEQRRRYTPPPTPPLVKPSSKGKFPTTPPPQKKNKLCPDSFQPLTKSKSHESQLSMKVSQDVDLSRFIKKKPGNLILGSSEAIIQRKRSTGALDDVTGKVSGQSSPLLSSPFRSPQFKSPDAGSDSVHSFKMNQLVVPPVSPLPVAGPRSMMHAINHKFQNKLVMSTCDLCRKHIFRGRVCKYCKIKYHRDCATKVAPSCGLPEELLDIIMASMHKDDGSPDLSRRLASYDRTVGIQAFPAPDSSSATSSCNSSTPSSPAVASGPAHYASPSSPAHQSRVLEYSSYGSDTQFRFPDPSTSVKEDSSLSNACSNPTFSVSSVDVVNTNTSNDSDKSDKTLVDTGSGSERAVLLDRVDSQESSEEPIAPNWTRVNSISVALKEWDIPYDELIVGDVIGIGRFGIVSKGNWHGDVAIKVLNMDPDMDNQAQLQAFKLEVAMLRKTRHENLVLFMGACMTPPRLAIITSLCKGQTLFTQLHVRKEKFPMNRIVIIASQIAQGMGYLHAKGIVHKDLKSKNVFLESGKVVITDFGLFSVTKLCHGSRKGRWLSIPPGWLCYLAPEIMRSLRAGNQREMDLPFTDASDIYAFGTVWYELLCGEWPFKKQPPEAIIWQVGKGMKQSLTNNQVSRDVKDILMQCWAYKASERTDFKELLKVLDRLPKKRLARSPSHPIQLSRSAESVF